MRPTQVAPSSPPWSSSRSTLRRGAAHAARSRLCYNGDIPDSLLNAVALLLVSLSLLLRSILAKSLTLEERCFWLVFAVLAAGVQLLLSELMQTEGVSVLWCALLGLMAQGHLSFAWQPSVSVPSAGEISCAAAAAAVGVVILAYYAGTGPISTTIAHATALGAGFGAGLGSHGWPLAAVLSSLAAAVAALAVALCLCRRRRARAARAYTTRRASEDDLAIAQLQLQLLRTRDEAARLLQRSQQPESTPAPRETGLAVASADLGGAPAAAPAPAPSAADLASPSTAAPARASEQRPELVPSSDESAELEVELARLRLREQQLVERLEVRRRQSKRSSFQVPAPRRQPWLRRPLRAKPSRTAPLSETSEPRASGSCGSGSTSDSPLVC